MFRLFSLRISVSVAALLATVVMSSPAWSQYDGLNFSYGGGGNDYEYDGGYGYNGGYGVGGYGGGYNGGYGIGGYGYNGYSPYGNGYGIRIYGKGYDLYGGGSGLYKNGYSRERSQLLDLTPTFKPWYGFYPLERREAGQAPAEGIAAKSKSAPRSIAEHFPGHSATARTKARRYQRRAEQAFRIGRYASSVQLANHALAELPHDGKLLLLLSHALFASGDYEAAAGAIHKAISLLEKDNWGFIVRNSRSYYRGRAYVKATEKLNQFIEENPKAAYARFLRAYHFGFLGQNDFARKEMTKAIELESRDQLAVVLLKQFGGAPPLAAATQEPPPAAGAAVEKPKANARSGADL